MDWEWWCISKRKYTCIPLAVLLGSVVVVIFPVFLQDIQMFTCGILNTVPNFIHMPQWQNRGTILDMEFLNYLNHTTQLFNTSFLSQMIGIRTWSIINFIVRFGRINYKTNLINRFSITHMSVCSLCWFNDTEIIVTQQRRCCVRDPYIFLQCTVLHHPI